MADAPTEHQADARQRQAAGHGGKPVHARLDLKVSAADATLDPGHPPLGKICTPLIGDRSMTRPSPCPSPPRLVPVLRTSTRSPRSRACARATPRRPRRRQRAMIAGRASTRWFNRPCASVVRMVRPIHVPRKNAGVPEVESIAAVRSCRRIYCRSPRSSRAIPAVRDWATGWRRVQGRACDGSFGPIVVVVGVFAQWKLFLVTIRGAGLCTCICQILSCITQHPTPDADRGAVSRPASRR